MELLRIVDGEDTLIRKFKLCLLGFFNKATTSHQPRELSFMLNNNKHRYLIQFVRKFDSTNPDSAFQKEFGKGILWKQLDQKWLVCIEKGKEAKNNLENVQAKKKKGN